MKTPFQRAYDRTVKTMTVAKRVAYGEDKPMTTPLTPENELKLVEVLFHDHLFHWVTVRRAEQQLLQNHLVYIRFDAHTNVIIVDYKNNPDHKLRLIRLCFRLLLQESEIQGKLESLAEYVADDDIDYIKRMALELIR